jgi:uncharacterized protein YmfQ (DUF2313 family)
MSDTALKAIKNAWDQWHIDIKYTVTDFSFKEWCKHECGFEYRHFNSGDAVITTVLDQKKYAWFLLRWS